ncbi:PREDICTED: slit homolog 1 protein [Rhagoletis zephyria]|uniref:slit homolog 1 protein n=1 Tax=Rhagoletis zephyria TaxID=28612 RepID=UPI0008116C50|nr:PREDICTED: slit homolog 1 protein [Rhagoletis zephyria]XP_036332289.1 slit homolog 1 protein [Rhagoletis pomonella]
MICRQVCFTISVSILLLCPKAEVIDENEIERFCYPEQHKNTRKSCECSNDNAPPWGIRAINIDCSYKNLKNADFSEVLPLYVNLLDLSWNAMDLVPTLASDSLRILNAMHNNISTISNKKFVKAANLRKLYLSWNSIQSIELNAFDELVHLQVLDLSHNNLHTLGLQLFRSLLVLETLNLSWNRHLNQTEAIQEQDFYRTFGVNFKIRVLRLQACSLTDLVLPEKAPLVELDLRHNKLEKIPSNLPSTLAKLDISENLFQTFSPAITANLSATISELYVEDMPRLQSVEENAFYPLTGLKKISFQNSRRLNKFSGHAFGAEASRFPELRTLIFRGTSVGSLNATLAPLFTKLAELDLNGMPLVCDCELVWIKEIKLDTKGRCFNPSRLRGESMINVENSDFSCAHWPHWVAGLFIFALILLCAAGIYAIVMCLRPNRGGVTLRRKVGSGSPYARVTIEPNRQENYY